MGAQTVAIVDKLLTNVLNVYVPDGYISEMWLPNVRVKQNTGKLPNIGNQHLRIQQTIMAGRGMARQAETIVRASDAYEIERHGLFEILTEDDFENVEKPFDVRQDTTMGLQTVIWLGKENSLASVLTDPAIITQGVTLVGTDQYSDYANSDPFGDWRLARSVIRAACGLPPDTVGMDWQVADTLRYHPEILDRLGFKHNRTGRLSDSDLAEAFGVRRVLVARPLQNTSAEGQPDSLASVWGKDLIFSVTPPTARLRQLSLGYYLNKTQHPPRQVFRSRVSNPPNAEMILVRDSYDMLVTNTACAYLIQDAVA